MVSLSARCFPLRPNSCRRFATWSALGQFSKVRALVHELEVLYTTNSRTEYFQNVCMLLILPQKVSKSVAKCIYYVKVL
jgi:hypothetical protein